MSLELRAQQRLLLQAIVGEQRDERGLLRPRQDGGAARLEIYRHAYRARLTAALADNYAVLQRALGDLSFDALAAAYIEACPSTRPSIRWFGDQLAEFMSTREDLVPHPALVDLARMDWALRDAFDAADAPALDLQALSGLPAGRLGECRFVPHPSVRPVSMSWAVEAAWRVLRAHEPESGEPEPELPEPEAQPHTLLVWRKDLQTQWRSWPEPQAQWLRMALEGAPFAQLCCAAALSSDDPAQAAATALGQWLQDGLFSRLEDPGG